MKYRKLTKKEGEQLKEYMIYAIDSMQKIKWGKEKNFRFYGKVGQDFPKSLGFALALEPLDSPHGLFKYFSGSIKKFTQILERGTISDKQALELNLHEPFEPDGLELELEEQA